MSQPNTSLTYSIPSNKFYPPHLDDSQALFRKELITHKLPGKHTFNKVITIEAQAGQGKTTLVYQYIQHHNLNYIWYQIGSEDSDPVLLLGALLLNFTKLLEGFTSPQLSNILQEGEIGPLDISRCVNILLADLDLFLEDNLYIVFDDLHLIEDATLSNSFISYMIDTSPPKLHFILTSRHPLKIKCKVTRTSAGSTHLNTPDLALNTQEVEHLFNYIYGWSINYFEAEKIHKITNGWPMGIALAAHHKSTTKTWDTLPTKISHGNMLDYFQEEIFVHIPQDIHTPFLQLSFLSEIQVELALHITGIEKIGKLLSNFAQDNLFIYRLDDDQQIFRFHHLYQEFLQQRAKKELGHQEIQKIYETAGSFYYERHILVNALTYYRHGENFARMDTILQKEGLTLLAQNRTITLLTLLRSIPENILTQHGWLTLYAGILAMDFSPETTLPLFESARISFINNSEEIGELTAIAQIIYYHFVISGRYNEAEVFLIRAEELFHENRDSLPAHATIWIARNIAAGFCFFSGNFDKAKRYITIAKELTTKHAIRNFIASTRFVLGYIELLSGNRTQCLRETEISYSLLNDPLVGMSNKLTLRVMHLCTLSMHGDYLNFFHQQHLLQQSIDDKIIKQTVAAPYLFVWGGSCLVSLGKIKEAQDLIHQGFEVSGTARSDHMSSQLLQWQAYTAILLEDKETAKSAIEESLHLRSIAGGPFYQIFNMIIAGAVYTRMNEAKRAHSYFMQAIEGATSIKSPYLLACGYLHLSYSQLCSQEENSALINLEKGLAIMKDNNFNHFWSWEPNFMGKLLLTAVNNNIEKVFCIQLAKKKLQMTIDEKGTPIPLLHFTLLDEFGVFINGNKILHVDDFTPFQREILGLLLISKGNKIHQDKVQLALWPDSPPSKARRKFDTLLGRLRKSFTNNLPLPIKNYIVIQKGILSLKNVQTDIQQFEELGTQAIKHCKKNEYWQAGNYFKSALALCKGNVPTNIFTSDPVYFYETTILDFLSSLSLTWAELLVEAGQADQATEVIENLIHINGIEEKAISFLCSLHSQANQPLKIRATLDRYKRSLQQLKYTNEEIDEILGDILSNLGQ